MQTNFSANLLRCRPGYTGHNCRGACVYPYYGTECQGHCECSEQFRDFTTGCRVKAYTKGKINVTAQYKR